jgi:hypothetical protein
MRLLPSSAFAHEVSVADDLAFCADAKVARCSGDTKLGPSYSGAPRILAVPMEPMKRMRQYRRVGTAIPAFGEAVLTRVSGPPL